MSVTQCVRVESEYSTLTAMTLNDHSDIRLIVNEETDGTWLDFDRKDLLVFLRQTLDILERRS